MDYKEKVIALLNGKELSQEQKEKLEEIFHELKESEDEKIRKELITHCRNTRCTTEEGAEKIAKWIDWLEKHGNIDKASYEIAEKEKYDFVSGQFIECRKSFDEFKEDNSYWFEYIGNDTYIGRSDNIINKKFHITPRQLYRLFTQQHCPQEDSNVNHETNAPMAYGEYVEDCLNEAAEHFYSDGADSYSVADLFHAGVRCGMSLVEKQDADKEYVFRPLAGTTIEMAIEQALEKGDVVLAFNGFYNPVKGKTSDEILTEYDQLIEKQGEQKPIKVSYATIAETGDGSTNALITGELPTVGYEDWRIWKAILSCCLDHGSKYKHLGVTMEEMCAWLEKQGEQNTLNPDKVIEWLKTEWEDLGINWVRGVYADEIIDKFKKDFGL